MSHVHDETSVEGEGFNFNQWLIKNDLLTLKELFIKLKANTASTLQITSNEMQSVMTDMDFLSQPQMVPKVMTAIHQLSATVEKTVDRIVTVVLSEKEQAVIDDIKMNLKTVDGMEEEVNRLKSQYPKSQQRVENMEKEQITAITAKINETFDGLFAALTQRKQALLEQLNLIETKKKEEDDAKHNDDDEKEVDELIVCTEKIDNLRQFLKDKEVKYNDLLSAQKDSAERQSEILQIGKDVHSEFAAKQSEIGKATKTMAERIVENNDS